MIIDEKDVLASLKQIELTVRNQFKNDSSYPFFIEAAKWIEEEWLNKEYYFPEIQSTPKGLMVSPKATGIPLYLKVSNYEDFMQSYSGRVSPYEQSDSLNGGYAFTYLDEFKKFSFDFLIQVLEDVCQSSDLSISDKEGRMVPIYKTILSKELFDDDDPQVSQAAKDLYSVLFSQELSVLTQFYPSEDVLGEYSNEYVFKGLTVDYLLGAA